jgi:hypothetical protein
MHTRPIIFRILGVEFILTIFWIFILFSPRITPVFAAGSSVVINEVLYNPSNTNDSGLEWIKLFNPTDTPINLSGFQLNATSGDYYTFPDNFVLGSKSFVTVHWATDGNDSGTELFTGINGFSNMGDSKGWVALFNSSTHSSRTIIDYIEYGAGGQIWESTAVNAGIWQGGAFITNASVGNSIKLKVDGEDNNLASDWMEYTLATPTPTPTDTPTPTSNLVPTSTPTPTLAKTPTPTKASSPTPTKSPTSSPTLARSSGSTSIAPTISSEYNPTNTVSEAENNSQYPFPEILGESSVAGKVSPSANPKREKQQENPLPFIFIGIGGVMILACAIIVLQKYKDKLLADDDEDF